MYFRPYPVLSVLTLLGLGLLIWLGQWQVSRMGEKAAQIAAYEAVADAEPVDLNEALCLPEIIEGRPILPAPAEGAEVAFWGLNGDGEGGWRYFVPVATPECAGPELILQEVRFESFAHGVVESPQRLSLRAVPEPGLFDAANDPQTNSFHRYDAEQMAGVAGVDSLSADYWIVADNGLPSELAEVPPSRHFGYALTWFGLAAVLIAVFLAFHVAQGRLGFTRR